MATSDRIADWAVVVEGKGSGSEEEGRRQKGRSRRAEDRVMRSVTR